MTTSKQIQADSELVKNIFKLARSALDHSEDLIKKLFTTVNENTEELQLTQFIIVS